MSCLWCEGNKKEIKTFLKILSKEIVKSNNDTYVYCAEKCLPDLYYCLECVKVYHDCKHKFIKSEDSKKELVACIEHERLIDNMQKVRTMISKNGNSTDSTYLTPFVEILTYPYLCLNYNVWHHFINGLEWMIDFMGELILEQECFYKTWFFLIICSNNKVREWATNCIGNISMIDNDSFYKLKPIFNCILNTLLEDDSVDFSMAHNIEIEIKDGTKLAHHIYMGRTSDEIWIACGVIFNSLESRVLKILLTSNENEKILLLLFKSFYDSSINIWVFLYILEILLDKLGSSFWLITGITGKSPNQLYNDIKSHKDFLELHKKFEDTVYVEQDLKYPSYYLMVFSYTKTVIEKDDRICALRLFSWTLPLLKSVMDIGNEAQTLFGRIFFYLTDILDKSKVYNLLYHLAYKSIVEVFSFISNLNCFWIILPFIDKIPDLILKLSINDFPGVVSFSKQMVFLVNILVAKALGKKYISKELNLSFQSNYKKMLTHQSYDLDVLEEVLLIILQNSTQIKPEPLTENTDLDFSIYEASNKEQIIKIEDDHDDKAGILELDMECVSMPQTSSIDTKRLGSHSPILISDEEGDDQDTNAPTNCITVAPIFYSYNNLAPGIKLEDLKENMKKTSDSFLPFINKDITPLITHSNFSNINQASKSIVSELNQSNFNTCFNSLLSKCNQSTLLKISDSKDSESIEINQSIKYKNNFVKVSKKLEQDMNKEKLLVNQSENVFVNQSEKSLVNQSEKSLVNKSEKLLLNQSEKLVVNQSETLVVNQLEKLVVNQSEKLVVNQPESNVLKNFETEKDMSNYVDKRYDISSNFNETVTVKKTAQKPSGSTLMQRSSTLRRERIETELTTKSKPLKLPNLNSTKALTVSNLHKSIFDWKVEWFENQTEPVETIKCLKNAGINFETYDEYCSTFWNLILCEAQSLVSKEWKLYSSKMYKITEVNEHKTIDTSFHIKCEYKSDAIYRDCPEEDDLVLLKFNGENQSVNVFGIVEKAFFLKKKYENSAVTIYVLNIKLAEISNSKTYKIVSIQKLLSLRTVIRQFNALTVFKNSLLAPDILKPFRMKTFNWNEEPITQGKFKRLSKLNLMQLHAVSTVSHVCQTEYVIPRIVLLQGPPGTGKSYTIKTIILHLMQEFYKSNKTSPNRKPQRILFCAPSNVAVDEIVRRLVSSPPYRDDSDDHSIKYGNCGDFNIVRVGSKKQVAPDLVEYSLKYQLKRELNKYQSSRIKSNIIEKIKLLKSKQQHLDTECQNLRLSKNQYESEQYTLKTEERSRIQKSLDELNFKLNSLSEKSDNQVDLSEIKNSLQRQILLRADIVCSTLSEAGSKPMIDAFKRSSREISFRCVIIDEAGHCTEPDALIPLQYGSSKLVLVGDSAQLPATVISQKARQLNFGQSLFERLYKGFMINTNTRVHPAILLKCQYRMAPDICWLPNKRFYNNELKSETQRKLISDMKHYVFLNLNEARENRNQAGGKYYPVECEHIAAICEKIIMEKIANAHEIAVITPYRHKAIKELINKQFEGIEVDIIDAFQGREKRIVIFSYMRASIYQESIDFLCNPQRMHVALTRAKDALIILFNCNSIEIGEDWKAVVNDAKERNLLFNVKTCNDTLKCVFKTLDVTYEHADCLNENKTKNLTQNQSIIKNTIDVSSTNSDIHCFSSCLKSLVVGKISHKSVKPEKEKVAVATTEVVKESLAEEQLSFYKDDLTICFQLNQMQNNKIALEEIRNEQDNFKAELYASNVLNTHVLSKAVINEPTINQSVLNKHAVNVPELNKPTVDSPALNKPTVDEPGFNKLTVGASELNKHTVDAPALNKPTVNVPSINEPAVNVSGFNKLSVNLPALNEPIVNVLALNKHTFNGTALSELAVNVSGFKQFSVSMPTLNVPSVDVPVLSKPKVNLPEFDKPVFNVPQFNKPEVNVLALIKPTVYVPGFNETAVNVSGFNAPSVNVLAICKPAMDEPELNKEPNNNESSFKEVVLNKPLVHDLEVNELELTNFKNNEPALNKLSVKLKELGQNKDLLFKKDCKIELLKETSLVELNKLATESFHEVNIQESLSLNGQLCKIQTNTSTLKNSEKQLLEKNVSWISKSELNTSELKRKFESYKLKKTHQRHISSSSAQIEPEKKSVDSIQEPYIRKVTDDVPIIKSKKRKRKQKKRKKYKNYDLGNQGSMNKSIEHCTDTINKSANVMKEPLKVDLLIQDMKNTVIIDVFVDKTLSKSTIESPTYSNASNSPFEIESNDNIIDKFNQCALQGHTTSCESSWKCDAQQNIVGTSDGIQIFRKKNPSQSYYDLPHTHIDGYYCKEICKCVLKREKKKRFFAEDDLLRNKDCLPKRLKSNDDGKIKWNLVPLEIQTPDVYYKQKLCSLYNLVSDPRLRSIDPSVVSGDFNLAKNEKSQNNHATLEQDVGLCIQNQVSEHFQPLDHAIQLSKPPLPTEVEELLLDTVDDHHSTPMDICEDIKSPIIIEEPINKYPLIPNRGLTQIEGFLSSNNMLGQTRFDFQRHEPLCDLIINPSESKQFSPKPASVSKDFLEINTPATNFLGVNDSYLYQPRLNSQNQEFLFDLTINPTGSKQFSLKPASVSKDNLDIYMPISDFQGGSRCLDDPCLLSWRALEQIKFNNENKYFNDIHKTLQILPTKSKRKIAYISPQPIDHQSNISPQPIEIHQSNIPPRPIDHQSNISPQHIETHQSNIPPRPIDHQSNISPQHIETHRINIPLRPLDNQSNISPQHIETHLINIPLRPLDNQSNISPQHIETHQSNKPTQSIENHQKEIANIQSDIGIIQSNEKQDINLSMNINEIMSATFQDSSVKNMFEEFLRIENKENVVNCLKGAIIHTIGNIKSDTTFGSTSLPSPKLDLSESVKTYNSNELLKIQEEIKLDPNNNCKNEQPKIKELNPSALHISEKTVPNFIQNLTKRPHVNEITLSKSASGDAIEINDDKIQTKYDAIQSNSDAIQTKNSSFNINNDAVQRRNDRLVQKIENFHSSPPKKRFKSYSSSDHEKTSINITDNLSKTKFNNSTFECRVLIEDIKDNDFTSKMEPLSNKDKQISNTRKVKRVKMQRSSNPKALIKINSRQLKSANKNTEKTSADIVNNSEMANMQKNCIQNFNNKYDGSYTRSEIKFSSSAFLIEKKVDVFSRLGSRSPTEKLSAVSATNNPVYEPNDVRSYPLNYRKDSTHLIVPNSKLNFDFDDGRNKKQFLKEHSNLGVVKPYIYELPCSETFKKDYSEKNTSFTQKKINEKTNYENTPCLSQDKRNYELSESSYFQITSYAERPYNSNNHVGDYARKHLKISHNKRNSYRLRP